MASEYERYLMGTSRKYDLTMFAGFHLGWITKHGGTVPHVTMEEIHEMIEEYMGHVGPNKDTDDGDTGKRPDTSSVGESGEDTP
jgi:hypothetical protein